MDFSATSTSGKDDNDGDHDLGESGREKDRERDSSIKNDMVLIHGGSANNLTSSTSITPSKHANSRNGGGSSNRIDRDSSTKSSYLVSGSTGNDTNNNNTTTGDATHTIPSSSTSPSAMKESSNSTIGSATKKYKKEKKPRKKRKVRSPNDDLNDPSLSGTNSNNNNSTGNNSRFASSDGNSEKSIYNNSNNSSSSFKQYELKRERNSNIDNSGTAGTTTSTSTNSGRPGPKKGSKKRKEGKLPKDKLKSSDLDETYHPRRGSVGSLSSSHRDGGHTTSSSTSKLKGHSSSGISGSNSNTSGIGSGLVKKLKKAKTSHSSRDSNNIDYLDPLSHGSSSIYSPEQATVNDMMRRALEEDQYSALGSVVDTDSSEDEKDDYYSYNDYAHASSSSHHYNHHSSSMGGYHASSNSAMQSQNHLYTRHSYDRLDRGTLLNAVKKRLRVIRSGGSHKTKTRDSAHSDALYDPNSMHHSRLLSSNAGVGSSNHHGEDGGTTIGASSGGRKKKRKKGKRGGVSSKQQQQQTNYNSMDHHSNLEHMNISTSDNDDVMDHHGINMNNSINDRTAVGGRGSRDRDFDDHTTNNNVMDDDDDEEEGSIFGQTAGSTNATWVVCDKCEKWRRLRGVVDAKKLPSKWYCSMNKNDPERARCSAPEEAYDTPESATDHRARKHLRLWVRRLQSNEAYEARLPTMTRGKKRSNSSSAKEPYEWVRCCSPSCGKWRAILKFMDANSVMERAKNGEWYCVLNTWDEKFASCAAPQENLPAIGCPPWVIQDEE